MISFKHRFIFVHVPKVAGTSITEALSPFIERPPRWRKYTNSLSKRLVGSRIVLPKRGHLPPHATARDHRAVVGGACADFYRFAFVRNPYDWQVSLYEYVRQTPIHYQHELILQMTFDDYVRWRCDGNYIFQKDFVTDEDGANLMDFVGRFETLAQDFLTATKAIGISANLPHSNRSKRRQFSSYYSAETQAMIADTYRADFEYLGYSRELSAD